MKQSLLIAPLLAAAFMSAASAESSVRPVRSTPAVRIDRRMPSRSPDKPMAGRTGQRGVVTIDGSEPRKSKQDIADEKKLEHDMIICKGC